MILKWQVQIIKRPEYNDELNVYTWSTSANKLFADRDFKVLDNNGETIIMQLHDGYIWILTKEDQSE